MRPSHGRSPGSKVPAKVLVAGRYLVAVIAESLDRVAIFDQTFCLACQTVHER